MPRKGGGKGGKAGINDMPWASPLGQVQAPSGPDDWMQYASPICALTETPPSEWKTVGKRDIKMAVKIEETPKTISGSKYNFAAIHEQDDDDHEELPEIKEATKAVNPKMPRV